MSNTTAGPVTGSRCQRQLSGWWSVSVLGWRLGGALLDLLDDGRIGERRRVAESPPLGDVAQQAAHDLAGSGLGQLVGEDHRLRPGRRTDLLGDVLPRL